MEITIWWNRLNFNFFNSDLRVWSIVPPHTEKLEPIFTQHFTGCRNSPTQVVHTLLGWVLPTCDYLWLLIEAICTVHSITRFRLRAATLTAIKFQNSDFSFLLRSKCFLFFSVTWAQTTDNWTSEQFDLYCSIGNFRDRRFSVVDLIKWCSCNFTVYNLK